MLILFIINILIMTDKQIYVILKNFSNIFPTLSFLKKHVLPELSISISLWNCNSFLSCKGNFFNAYNPFPTIQHYSIWYIFFGEKIALADYVGNLFRDFFDILFLCFQQFIPLQKQILPFYFASVWDTQVTKLGS